MKHDHIRETLAIDPALHSQKVSENRTNSFVYAFAGILHMLRYAKNVRLQALMTLMVLLICAWLQIAAVEWALIIIVIGLNWVAEFINAAIEATVNLVTDEYHPMAHIAKDVAAGAVLMTTFIAVIVGCILLLPPMWEKVS